jgi:hypothetical protein
MGPRLTALHHDARVTVLTMSLDRKSILTGTTDGIAHLWDAKTRAPRHTLRGHTGDVYAVAFSPDGKTALTGGRDKTAKLWDARTGKLLHTLPGHRLPVSQAVFSPDGTTVATVSGQSFLGLPGDARLWDVLTGRPLGGPLHHQNTLAAFAFSSDGRTQWTWGKDRVVRGWDARTGQPSGRTLPLPDVVEWRAGVAFSADGRELVAGLRGTVRRWNLTTGKPTGDDLEHDSPVTSVAFLRGGDLLLACGNEGISVWESTSGRKLDPRQLSETIWYYDEGGGQLRCRSLDGTAGEIVFDGWFPTADNETNLRYLGQHRMPLAVHDQSASLPFGPELRGYIDSNRVELRRKGPLPGSPEQLRLWAEVISRHTLDEQDRVVKLDEPAWEERRRRFAAEAERSGLPDYLAVAGGDALFWLAQEAGADHSPKVLPHLDRLIRLAPTWNWLVLRAQIFASQGQFEMAARDFQQAIKSRGHESLREPVDLHQAGIACLASGDREGYRRACAVMNKRLDAPRDIDGYRAWAELALLSQDSGADFGQLVKRLAQPGKLAPGETPKVLMLGLGAIVRSGGSIDMDAKLLARMLQTEYPVGWLLTALHQHKRGDTAVAKDGLGKATRWLADDSAKAKGRSWDQILAVKILCREVEATLAGRAP